MIDAIRGFSEYSSFLLSSLGGLILFLQTEWKLRDPSSLRLYPSTTRKTPLIPLLSSFDICPRTNLHSSNPELSRTVSSDLTSSRKRKYWKV